MTELFGCAAGVLIESLPNGMIQMTLPGGGVVRLTTERAIELAGELDAAATDVEFTAIVRHRA